MVRLKSPLLSLDAHGTLSKAISFVKRRRQKIAERTPVVPDQKSPAQLAWRPMFLACKDLWHTLSAAEKAAWESAATPRHMTGYAWYMSQCLRPNPGIYLPLAGGTMTGVIDMDGQLISALPAPIAANDAVRKAYVDLFTLSSTFNTHEVAITGIHGVGDSIIDSVLARNAAIAAAVGAKDVGEGHITILPFAYFNIVQGTWAISPVAPQGLSITILNTSSANNDSIQWRVFLAAGTYTLCFFTITTDGRAILDVDIDAAEVASFDCYSGATIFNVIKRQTGIIVASSGVKLITTRLDGRNASSSAFLIDIVALVFWRTA